MNVQKKAFVSGAWSSNPTNACTSALRLKFGEGNGLENQPSVSNDDHDRGATQTSITGWVFDG